MSKKKKSSLDYLIWYSKCLLPCWPFCYYSEPSNIEKKDYMFGKHNLVRD